MRPLLSFVAVCILVAACSSAATPDPTQERVEEWAAGNDIESVGVAIIDGGELRAYGVGEGADARYQVGSLTKAVIGAVVLGLAADGKLGLDDPVGSWLDDFPADFTVRDALRHRSGLRDGGDRPPALADLTGILAPATPSQLLADAAELAGEDRSPAYSNANYWVVGGVIEAVTGRALEEVIEARIAQPLDIDLGYGWLDAADSVAGQLVFGTTEVSFLPDLEEALLTRAWAAGGIVASAPDMATFFDALFDELLPAGAIAEMVATGPGSIYGLGVQDRGEGTWGHDGVLPGFTAAAVRSRDPEGATVVVLTNRMVVTPEGVVPDARAFARELLATVSTG